MALWDPGIFPWSLRGFIREEQGLPPLDVPNLPSVKGTIFSHFEYWS